MSDNFDKQKSLANRIIESCKKFYKHDEVHIAWNDYEFFVDVNHKPIFMTELQNHNWCQEGWVGQWICVKDKSKVDFENPNFDDYIKGCVLSSIDDIRKMLSDNGLKHDTEFNKDDDSLELWKGEVVMALIYLESKLFRVANNDVFNKWGQAELQVENYSEHPIEAIDKCVKHLIDSNENNDDVRFEEKYPWWIE